MKKVHLGVIIAGAAVGLAALILTALGNPTNMGFCIACFERDIAGAVGLHSAAKVQYVRPEIIGLVLGAFIMSVATREFRARAGSAPAVRFVLGGFVMIGALAFLGCPLRMVLRLGGGDLNALVGLVGFTIGISIGVVFLKKGFTLGRSYEAKQGEGGVLPIVMAALLILVLERTRMIGLLKAMGMENRRIRRIFLYRAAFIVGRGLLWGNLAAGLLCWFQARFHLLRLDPAGYMLSEVPVAVSAGWWLAVDVAAAGAILALLLVPAAFVARIRPDEAIKTD